jgi:hypothetical protein
MVKMGNILTLSIRRPGRDQSTGTTVIGYREGGDSKYLPVAVEHRLRCLSGRNNCRGAV